ncbi:odorant receptor 13a-like isoform X2 [Diachasmimorpha longicaudata]|uniref:odorant receptor 13a-like isoform X2 n=1 Tax=Diachasmimorpha longicaudata TaxID=58733 RepID=UPI0030B8A5ED
MKSREMDADAEVEYERVKNLLNRISWPLDIGGIWPKNTSLSAHLRSTIFMTYYALHISIQFLDFLNVIGSLELVIANLVESTFQPMVLIRLFTIRRSKLTLRIIEALEEDMAIENFKDREEIRILSQYASMAEKFYRIAGKMAALAAVVYYVTPVQTYLVKRLMNRNAVLINPYRIYHFVDISSLKRTAIVYVCQCPMMYAATTLIITYAVIFSFVMIFCGQLAVLSHRILNMKKDNTDPRVFFRRHARQHIKISVMMQWLNEAFRVALLYDRFATTVLIGLICYKLLLDIHDVNVFGIFQLVNYVVYMTLLVYLNCFMGECLNTECTALLNAYYDCEWYDMTDFQKKALIICMRTSQEPIRLTAGKYYVFSLDGFAQTMKASMVYVSMLRKLI